MSNKVTGQDLRSYREQAVSATVHLACEGCRAPGVFSTDPRIKMDWPGCYVEVGDEKDGQPVGNRCPNCSAPRDPTLMNRLGEIWRKRFSKED